jgi:hypothetical protein
MRTMKSIAEITLIENSTAGNTPKIFAEQIVSISHVADTVQKSVDGFIAIGHRPSMVLWYGGFAKYLNNITDVKIVSKNGGVLIDGELNTFNGVPNDVPGGVEFYVLKRG